MRLSYNIRVLKEVLLHPSSVNVLREYITHRSELLLPSILVKLPTFPILLAVTSCYVEEFSTGVDVLSMPEDEKFPVFADSTFAQSFRYVICHSRRIKFPPNELRFGARWFGARICLGDVDLKCSVSADILSVKNNIKNFKKM